MAVRQLARKTFEGHTSAISDFSKDRKDKGIRISTRPDEINESIIQILVDYGVSTVEIGVESFSDEVLRLSKRDHTEEDVKRAHELLKGRFREVFNSWSGYRVKLIATERRPFPRRFPLDHGGKVFSNIGSSRH